jgi:hypothetical protein
MPLAERLFDAFSGRDPEEPAPPIAEIHDLVGEFANMICGSWLTRAANERTFAIAIMLGASVSFIAPFEPSCILVYGPGKYKFKDVVKTGAPLTAILTAILLLMLPVFWPLHSPAGPKVGTAPATSSTNDNLSPQGSPP